MTVGPRGGLVVGALLLSGCPWFGPGGGRLPEEATYCSDAPDTAPDDAHLEVELGQVDAQDDFTPLVDGQTMRLLRGGQGGHMVPLWVRLSDEETGCARIDLELWLESGGAGDASVGGGLDGGSVGSEDGLVHHERTERTVKEGATEALLVQIDDLTGWTSGAGSTLRIHATITTRAGQGQQTVSLRLVE